MHSLQLVGLLQDTHSTKGPTRGELEPIFVSASYCHSPADPDRRSPAPVGEGEPAAGAVLQSPAGEGHGVLPAAPNNHTLTPSLMECMRVHLLCMNRVHTINCTQVVYQYCDIGMIACRFSSMCKYTRIFVNKACLKPCYCFTVQLVLTSSMHMYCVVLNLQAEC